MNAPKIPTTEPFYPIVTSHIENDPTPRDQAIYIPSVTPNYAIAAREQLWKRQLPDGVADGDLNFLDPTNPLFRITHVMSSAGQALTQKRDCIITQRDRKNTLLLCDSGGYQIASGRLRISSDADRYAILRWMEKHGNYAMTLDVPTAPVLSNPGYAYRSTQDCLDATLEHLNFFQRNRSSSDLRLLNVLQGNTPPEADAWYAAVKNYEFEGWAFGGPLRNNMYELCRRIIIMSNEEKLQDRKWIHVLGTCELDTAVLLTALQRSINRHINPDLRISFDTSSPFRNIGWGNIYTIPTLGMQQMEMPTKAMPNAYKYIGSDLRWPWPSPLGDKMRMKDICVLKSLASNNYHDIQSNFYMAHHNLSALCLAMALANRVFDSESAVQRHTIALPVGAAVEAIDNIIKSGTLFTLSMYKTTFSNIRHSKNLNTSEEERDVEI